MSPTGHLAIGLVLKNKSIKLSLFWILIGTSLIDIIYLILSVLKIENLKYDPWSHSLFMAIVYTVTLGLITIFFTKQIRSGLVMGFAVLSHWILDFIVWDNLTLAFEGTSKIGLGFYKYIGFDLSVLSLNRGSIIATCLELTMLFIGIYYYRHNNRRLNLKSNILNQESEIV